MRKTQRYTQVSRELDSDWRYMRAKVSQLESDNRTPIVATLCLCIILPVFKMPFFCAITPLIHAIHVPYKYHAIYSDTKWTEIIDKINRWKSHNVKPCQEKNKKWNREWHASGMKRQRERERESSGKEAKTHFHWVRRFMPIVHISQCIEVSKERKNKSPFACWFPFIFSHLVHFFI